jgi:endogenous inhibitor of DNA gyrase (YacG/DUF329 family)
MSGGSPQEKKLPDAERKCPICGKPATRDHLPFCSRRCANVDLNRWLSGNYAIPGTAKEADEDETAPPD